MDAQRRAHWERVYSSRAADEVSWFAASLESSLRLIRQLTVPTLAVIDVGGGASTLVDDLLACGYQRLSVLDVAEAALQAARQRLGPLASRVQWIRADITAARLPAAAYDLWHDRAVFHFLTEAEDRQAYVANLRQALKPGGHVIIAAFAPDGPARCSGLEVQRYDLAALSEALGEDFVDGATEPVVHVTPQGKRQSFGVHRFRRR